MARKQEQGRMAKVRDRLRNVLSGARERLPELRDRLGDRFPKLRDRIASRFGGEARRREATRKARGGRAGQGRNAQASRRERKNRGRTQQRGGRGNVEGARELGGAIPPSSRKHTPTTRAARPRASAADREEAYVARHGTVTRGMGHGPPPRSLDRDTES